MKEVFSTAKNVKIFFWKPYQAGNKEFHVGIRVSANRRKSWSSEQPDEGSSQKSDTTPAYSLQQQAVLDGGGPHTARQEVLW